MKGIFGIAQIYAGQVIGNSTNDGHIAGVEFGVLGAPGARSIRVVIVHWKRRSKTAMDFSPHEGNCTVVNFLC
jgi:hypothetical protein